MKALRGFLGGLAALLLLASPVLAQTGLNLSVRKDFGYNNGSQIRGTFSMSVSSPESLRSVTFFIDGKQVGVASAAPFSWQFQTTDFADGWHQLTATALTAGGQALTSDARRFEFISQAQEQSGMSRIIVPILGIVAGIFVLMIGFQFLAFRSRKREPVPLGAHRRYGIRGGAICPRCGRPTPIHLTALNVGIGTKLDTCENCGRFGLLRPRPLEELRRAEAAEVADARPDAPVREQSAEERLREQLDSSRYDEMK